MPGAKNGERPYPEAPKRHFWGPEYGATFSFLTACIRPARPTDHRLLPSL